MWCFNKAQVYKEMQGFSVSEDVLNNSSCFSLTQAKLVMKSEQLEPVTPAVSKVSNLSLWLIGSFALWSTEFLHLTLTSMRAERYSAGNGRYQQKFKCPNSIVYLNINIGKD